jgi:hypothetical protein
VDAGGAPESGGRKQRTFDMDMGVNEPGRYHTVARCVATAFNPCDAPVFYKNFPWEKFSCDNIGNNSLV